MAENLMTGIIFIVVGGGLILLALFFLMRTRNFLAKAQETKGSVIEMIWKSDSDGGGGYSPVYEFRTITGQTITVQDNLSTNPPTFEVGQAVDVLYDPEKPQDARIKKWMNLYFVPGLLGFLGFIFGCVGAGLIASSFFNMPFS